MSSFGQKPVRPSKADERRAYADATERDDSTISNRYSIEWKRPRRVRKHSSRGLTQQIGTSDWRAEMDSTRLCSVEECGRAHKAHGLCNMHRLRMRNSGTLSLPPRPSLADRFWQKVTRSGDDECWTWTGAINSVHGYGRMGLGGRAQGNGYAHRVSYELNVGPIPDGLTIDHLCVNPRCVNPRHLEAVTQEENSRRAKRRWTHCIRGHEFTDENTYWRAEGRRACRACARTRRKTG